MCLVRTPLGVFCMVGVWFVGVQDLGFENDVGKEGRLRLRLINIFISCFV